jgi:hypothetical protein
MGNLLNKKYLGIPVLYLIGGFVAILAFIAWRMKPSAAPQGDAETSTDETDAAADAAAADYSKLATNGTVTVQQGQDPATVTPVVVDTNATWISKGTSWLVSQGLSGGTEAQDALRKYTAGESISVHEKTLVDAVIKQYGAPPEGVTLGGVTQPSPTPAVTQGKPPLVHTVRGSGDNDFYKLSKLYYGGQLYAGGVDLLEYHNPSLPRGNNSLAVGTKVAIVPYSEKWYTPGAPITVSALAKKVGTTPTLLAELNNVPQSYTFPKGRKVRIPS